MILRFSVKTCQNMTSLLFDSVDILTIHTYIHILTGGDKLLDRQDLLFIDHNSSIYQVL